MPHPSSDGDEASLQLDAVIGALEELLVGQTLLHSAPLALARLVDEAVL